MAKKGWGFDVQELSGGTRAQDDFFKYVNEKWMAANSIPANESRWGSFIKLRYEADQKLRKILQELDTLKRVTPGSPEQLIRDFYRSGMDTKRRNALGLAPLEEFRARIRGAKDRIALERLIADLERLGSSGPFGVLVDQDSKNSEKYALHLVQGGLGMPDRDYYLKDDPESLRVRNAYRIYAEDLFKLIGRAKTAAVDRDTLLRLETKFAEASMKKEDLQDAEKVYHKMTRAQLKKLAPAFDWDRYLDRIGAAKMPYVIVMQPEFLKAATELLATEPLEDLKTYFEWHLVNDFSSLLSSKFVRHAFSFYGTVLVGTKAMKPLWRRVLNVVNSEVGELLGRIYVKKHFTPEAKKRMNALVDDLFTAYEARLHSLTWMGPATKKKAFQKLRALTRKIGYPDKWRTYPGLRIDPKDYFGNVLRANEIEHKRAMRKLSGPIDRGEWFMYPQTVNAYFAPNLNDIAFPAAILQPPFFSLTQDDALNYGCIGMTIGHEMTHGFDAYGAKFDAKGNLKDWWQPEDKRRFEAKSKRVKEQFDQYTVEDGVRVNGTLTLGENIADLGGLSIAYDAYQLQLERTGRTTIDGLTPEQRFFIGFALFERENTRPEFEKMAVLTDPHSPGQFRINGPAGNFDAFYETFGVKKGDGMYRAPEEREMVW